MFFDAHLHLRDSRLLPFRDAFLNLMVDTGLRACIDCVSLLDQEDVPPPTHPALEIITAYGIHPWDAHRATQEDLARLEALLQQAPAALVGEIGLDGIRPISSDVRACQQAFFRDQLHLAQSYQRAVVLHGAKTWQPLFDFLLNEGGRLPALLLHGVNFAPELLQHPFFKQGNDVWFSLGCLLAHPHAKTLQRLLPHLPLHRILLESDAPDGGLRDGCSFHGYNHPGNLRRSLCALAQARGLTSEALLLQLEANASTFLNTLRRSS